MRTQVCLLLLALATGISDPMLAHAVLNRGQAIGSRMVYPDDERSGLHYYGPGEIVMATDSDGRPKLRLLMTRYVGTAAAGDQGASRFSSVLSVQVTHINTDIQDLESIRSALGGSSGIELRPLPIQRLEAALVYAPIGRNAESTSAVALPAGHFEGVEDEPSGKPSGYWVDRTYSLPLNDEEAQLLWETFSDGQVALSLGYAFVARGVGVKPQVELRGSPALVASLRDRLDSRSASDDSGKDVHEAVVRAGATSLTVDIARWPELLRRFDINETLPPAYAALSIYCYDFNNSLRPDLYEKQVDIAATSVTNKTVTASITFRGSEADVYAHSIRFPVAVRLDSPYRYRVREVGLDGSVTESPWVERGSWSRILDVTSTSGEETRDEANP